MTVTNVRCKGMIFNVPDFLIDFMSPNAIPGNVYAHQTRPKATSEYQVKPMNRLTKTAQAHWMRNPRYSIISIACALVDEPRGLLLESCGLKSLIDAKTLLWYNVYYYKLILDTLQCKISG